MEAPLPTDWRPRPEGRGWVVLAAVAIVLLVAHGLVAVTALVTWQPALAARTLAWTVFWWWVHRGAWLRSARGRPPVGTSAPWAEPVLTERRSRWYATLAAVGVAAAAVAVSLQALVLSD